MAGRWFEEWQVGDALVHDIRRTVTETDNLLFSVMTHNPQPLHIDAEAARVSEFGQILVNGTFTFALMIGLSVGDTTLGTLVTNLGYDELVMPAPVFLGDTLRARSEVTAVKESRSRPGAGVVTFCHELLNQRDEIVCRCQRSAMIRRRPGGGGVRLRSLLFVPGDRPERMEKALAFGADALILDLEDSVALTAKAAARASVASFLRAAERSCRLFVRINPLGSGLADDDLAAVLHARPDALVLPKAEGAASVLALAERAPGVPILPIATETPAAVFALGSYAQVAERLAGLTWGAEDLPAAIGAASARQEDGRYTPPYELVRSLTLFGAHAAGVGAIETVFPAFRDLTGLGGYVARAVRDGFTGMMAIHPSQVSTINHGFTPDAAAVTRACAVVAAFAAQPGAGVVTLDGAMLDAPHLKQAQAILARADEPA